MMHKYRAKDIHQCVGDRKIVFIGDSRMRQLFWAMAMKLDREQAESEIPWADRHSSMSFVGLENPMLDFIWDPYLNSTGLTTELTKVSSRNTTIEGNSKASIIMIGGGLWFAKNLNDSSLQRFNESVEYITRTLKVEDLNNREMMSVSPILLPQKDHDASLVMFAPVPKPLYASLDSAHANFLTPSRVQPLREKLLQAWHLHGFPVLWAFDMMTAMQPKAFQDDGLHVLDNVAGSMVDVMLNVKCNNFLKRSTSYPADKSCCSEYSQLDWIQKVFIFVAWSSLLGACLLPLMDFTVLKFVHDKEGRPNRASGRLGLLTKAGVWLSNHLPPYQISKAIAVLFLASYYCWWADRTPLMNKLQKQYSNKNFLTLCLSTLVVGLLSVNRSSPPRHQKSAHKQGSADAPFLSRDQTDEWKGWMQFVILIYHYTGASKILWIYKIVRLLVASYLFLTGYGHTIFFYVKSDYSLKRVAGVLLRLNMLTCTLPFIMKTDYIFYYFAPLVSFWYLIVYATMVVGRSHNNTPLFLIMKIITSATIMMIVIFHWAGLFESIFVLLEKIFNIHWDAADWHFRLQLDNLIVFVGMLVGVYTATNQGQKTIHYIRTEEDRMTDAPESFINLYIRSASWVFYPWLNHKRILYVVTPYVGCTLYLFLAYAAQDKERHNEYFAIVSFGPILTFVALRNSCSWMRRYHSRVFAWMGRYSLETFILQYHIWLAADTKGVLSTGFFLRNRDVGRWVDFVVLTTFFLWICWHVAGATQTLTAYIVEPSSMQEAEISRDDLPRTRGNECLEDKDVNVLVNGACRGVSDFMIGSLLYCFSRVKGHLAKDLWARLLLIMLVLWSLNLVSSMT